MSSAIRFSLPVMWVAFNLKSTVSFNDKQYPLQVHDICIMAGISYAPFGNLYNQTSQSFSRKMHAHTHTILQHDGASHTYFWYMCLLIIEGEEELETRVRMYVASWRMRDMPRPLTFSTPHDGSATAVWFRRLCATWSCQPTLLDTQTLCAAWNLCKAELNFFTFGGESTGYVLVSSIKTFFSVCVSNM